MLIINFIYISTKINMIFRHMHNFISLIQLKSYDNITISNPHSSLQSQSTSTFLQSSVYDPGSFNQISSFINANSEEQIVDDSTMEEVE